MEVKRRKHTKNRYRMLLQIAEEKEDLKAPQHSLVPLRCKSTQIAPKLLPPLTGGSSFPLSVWPSKSRRLVSGPKVPLAVQLEAFVRRDFQLYNKEHRHCAHADTLHIVNEAFSVLVKHFTEYREILSFIRDEYNAAFSELAEEVKLLRSLNLENESDRSLRAMELERQRERFTIIISNQHAQFKATQGLVHSLREQVASYEESNSALRNELELKNEEYEVVAQRTKMLAGCMVEEAVRNAEFIEDHQSNEREIGRLNAQVKSLKEKLEEADERFNALMKQMMYDGVRPLASRDTRKETKKLDAEPSKEIGEKEKEKEKSDNNVAALQRRVDDLLFDNEILRRQVMEFKREPPSVIDKSAGEVSPGETKGTGGAYEAVGEVISSKMIKSWMEEENILESELDELDYLLPPGMFKEDPLGFLKVCHPVRNFHLKRKEVIDMLRRFWNIRELHRQESLRKYFFDWLLQQTGTQRAAQEVGVNMLHVCQENYNNPECRGMMLVLRSFLPEDVISTCERLIKDMEKMCRETPFNDDGNIPTSFMKDALRIFMPEKSYVHMLQLRLYLWRLGGTSEMVSIDDLFNKDGHFVYLLKKQFLYEVEEFTLQVVEAIRSASEGSKMIRLQVVADVLLAQDRGISKSMMQRLVAEAAQLAAADVVTVDANFSVKVQLILDRFRSSVLLRRVTPPDENMVTSELTTFDEAILDGGNGQNN